MTPPAYNIQAALWDVARELKKTNPAQAERVFDVIEELALVFRNIDEHLERARITVERASTRVIRDRHNLAPSSHHPHSEGPATPLTDSHRGL